VHCPTPKPALRLVKHISASDLAENGAGFNAEFQKWIAKAAVEATSFLELARKRV
jgi:hypothetical protein